MMKRTSVLLLSLLCLSACQDEDKSSSSSYVAKNTLGELIPIYVSATSDVTDVRTEELITGYRDLLGDVDSEGVKEQVSARIAGLELALQEQKAIASEEAGEAYLPDYSAAIAAYKQALRDYPERETNDELYYQLAKAYDLGGDSANALAALTTLVDQYPQSQYFIESQFRRGDFLYSLGQYKPSQDAYAAVVEGGEDTAFYENAVYMHGWNLFKRNFYEPSAVNFTQVLDRTMPENGKMDGVEPGQQALVDDSLRVLGMIFSYLDGPDTIAVIFEQIGPRAYESLLYERLGELYISQERYRDAIRTFEAYIALNPYNVDAPYLQNKILLTLQQARLYTEAFKAKEDFIQRYAIGGDYYQQAEPETQAYLESYVYV